MVAGTRVGTQVRQVCGHQDGDKRSTKWRAQNKGHEVDSIKWNKKGASDLPNGWTKLKT